MQCTNQDFTVFCSVVGGAFPCYNLLPQLVNCSLETVHAIRFYSLRDLYISGSNVILKLKWYK